MFFSFLHAMSLLQRKAFTHTGSWYQVSFWYTLGTRFPHGKPELAWLHSCRASAQRCSNALSQGHKEGELEPLQWETQL